MSPRKQNMGLLCGFSAYGRHEQCAGTITKYDDDDKVISEAHCACHDIDHEPDEEMAERMARYRRPDLSVAGGQLLDELTQAILQEHAPSEEISIDTLKAMSLADLKSWAADYEIEIPATANKAQAVEHVWEAL